MDMKRHKCNDTRKGLFCGANQFGSACTDTGISNVVQTYINTVVQMYCRIVVCTCFNNEKVEYVNKTIKTSIY